MSTHNMFSEIRKISGFFFWLKRLPCLSSDYTLNSNSNHFAFFSRFVCFLSSFVILAVFGENTFLCFRKTCFANQTTGKVHTSLTIQALGVHCFLFALYFKFGEVFYGMIRRSFYTCPGYFLSVFGITVVFLWRDSYQVEKPSCNKIKHLLIACVFLRFLCDNKTDIWD